MHLQKIAQTLCRGRNKKQQRALAQFQFWLKPNISSIHIPDLKVGAVQ